MSAVCPFCGGPTPVDARTGLTLTHQEQGRDERCPSEGQNPRNGESDRRPTWRALGLGPGNTDA